MSTRARLLTALLAVLTASMPSSQAIGQAPTWPPSCPKQTYVPVPDNPDPIAKLMNGRKRYRLVIGTDQFEKNPGLNRPFVAPTAKRVDDSLAGIGYMPVGDFDGKPYLTGTAATKARIRDAILEMVKLVGRDDTGVLYFVGHGSITPNHSDLALSVYDRPVEPDEGIRLSDIVGYLSVSNYRREVGEIPQFVVVLETCYSGNVIPGITLTLQNGVQRPATPEGPVIPPQIAVMTATTDGDTSRAYELRGTGMSAFGHLFARALGDDWACSDSTPDGILTWREVFGYVQTYLKVVSDRSLIDGPMVPQRLAKDDRAFLAYVPEKYSIRGDRDLIVTINVVAKPGQVSVITFHNKTQFVCAPNCLLSVSKTMVKDAIVSEARPRFGVLLGSGSLDADNFILSNPKTIDAGDLAAGKQVRASNAQITIK